MRLITFPIALVVALGCTPIVINLLRRREVMDIPSARSSHSTPIPRGGGVAVAIATLGALVIGWFATDVSSRALAVAGLGFGLIGLADDVKSRSAIARLLAQFTVATASTLLLMRWTDLDGIAFAAVAALAIVGLVAFVNAFNFMDGINGISVVQAAVAGIAWACIGLAHNEPQLIVGGGALAGAVIGFAPFNVVRARVFLGDVGAYFLGGYMGVLALIALAAGIAPEACLAPTLIYFLDTGTTLVWRLRNGKKWNEPHRHHVYQRLTDAGWSHVRTAAFAAALIGLCALLGFLADNSSLTTRIIADTGLALAIFAYLDWPDSPRRGEPNPLAEPEPESEPGVDADDELTDAG